MNFFGASDIEQWPFSNQLTHASFQNTYVTGAAKKVKRWNGVKQENFSWTMTVSILSSKIRGCEKQLSVKCMCREQKASKVIEATAVHWKVKFNLCKDL